MTTERKAASNRRNAEQSTGPRTPPTPPAEPQTPAAPYTPSAKEVAILEAWQQRLRNAPRTPKLKTQVVDGKHKLAVDHPDAALGHLLLMEAMGTVDGNFPSWLVGQLARVTTNRGATLDADDVNFGLSVIAGVQPRDHLEALLATQMAAVHLATMTAAERLTTAQALAQHDSAERTLNKLARTFAMQMETLKRYRTGGEQRVVVQHVNVNDGGQAIVGNVNAGGGPRGGGGWTRREGYPMNKPLPMHLSPRCHATSKRTHKPCQAPAVRGWTVCHFHGAGGGAPRGERNGMYRHGWYTRERLTERREVVELLRHVREGLRVLKTL